MLPQAVSGIVVNAVVALILHRFSNKILMGISTVSYTASALLYGFMREDISYWALMFPSLILSVIGADIQFSVTNVRFNPLHSQSSCFHGPRLYILTHF